MLLHSSLPTASNHANPASRAQCVSQPNRLPSPRLSAKQTRHSAKLSLIHIFCNKTPLQATSCNRAPKPRASKKVIYYGAYKTICSLFFLSRSLSPCCHTAPRFTYPFYLNGSSKIGCPGSRLLTQIPLELW